jgi:hypothetical protein
MGLHTERSTIHWPEYVQAKVRKLWSTIVWQDSLLCLCYDRPPIVTLTGWSLDNSLLQRQDLSYREVMYFLTRLGLDIMQPEIFGASEADRSIEALQQVDILYQRGKPHLQARENCITFQEHLEHLALRMHFSFCVSVVCRPAMKQSQTQPLLMQTGILRARAKGSLIDASRAFLGFQALSVVPLRSWSMVHTVLSSTLLLCIWEETRNDPECRDLQQKVIEVFSSADSKASDEGGSGSENEGQWLSARHIRALVTLRSALDRQQDMSVPENETWTGAGVNPAQFASRYVFLSRITISTDLCSFLDGFFDVANPLDTSPVSYLDSIMNGTLYIPVYDGYVLMGLDNSPNVRLYTRERLLMKCIMRSIMIPPCATSHIDPNPCDHESNLGSVPAYRSLLCLPLLSHAVFAHTRPASSSQMVIWEILDCQRSD